MRPPQALHNALIEVYRSLDIIDEKAEAALAESWRQLLGHLPKTYWTGDEPHTATIPLYDALDNCGQAITDFCLPLLFDCPESLHGLRKQLFDNENRMNKLSAYERRKKHIPAPQERDEPPRELCYLYFHDTPLLEFFNTPINFRIDRPRFNEHGALFARSGHGKTRALRAFVAQFLQEPDPPALFLMDSMGSLIDGIDQLEVFNTTLRDRLVILDPSRAQYMPRLNFFDLKSDDLCFYLFKAIDQSFTPRQATMISYLMEYMRALPDPSILKLIEICESKRPLSNEAMAKLSPFAISFFQNQFFGKGDDLVRQTKGQIAQRLYTLGRLPKFNDIFSATTGAFDPYEHMQRKSVVLINTDARSPDLGGLGEQGSAIFGRYILAQCLAAARRRPKAQRHLALLVVDEFKAYADEQTGLILSDARQFGMGMLVATQQPHQLPEGVKREINTNTAIRMMGSIEYSIASQYARDMFCEPEFILGMKSYDYSHAEWATFVQGMDHALKVSIPFDAIERMPKSARPSFPTNAPITTTPDETSSERSAASLPAAEPTMPATAVEEPREQKSERVAARAKDPTAERLVKPGKEW